MLIIESEPRLDQDIKLTPEDREYYQNYLNNLRDFMSEEIADLNVIEYMSLVGEDMRIATLLKMH